MLQQFAHFYHHNIASSCDVMCVFGRWLLPEGTASAQPFDTTIVQRLQNFGTFSRTKKVGDLPACIHGEHQQQQILLTVCVFIKFAVLVACPC